MSCNSVTLTNIDARCDKSVGGIKRILVGLREQLVNVFTNDKGEVINLMFNGTLKEWKFRKNTGSFTSTANIDPTIDSAYFTTECAIQFSRAEAQKRLDIQSVINAGGVFIIIEDMYGEYLLLGKDRDVVITSATMQSGTSSTDLSGFNLTFTDTSLELPHFINKLYVDVNALIG